MVAVRAVEPGWPAWTIYLHEYGFEVQPVAPDHSRWGGWRVRSFTEAAAQHLAPTRDGFAIDFPNLAAAAGFVASRTT